MKNKPKRSVGTIVPNVCVMNALAQCPVSLMVSVMDSWYSSSISALAALCRFPFIQQMAASSPQKHGLVRWQVLRPGLLWHPCRSLQIAKQIYVP